MNEATRASAPGVFVRLPLGVTHYELGGPANAPTVVLVHGFSVPSYIWDPTFCALSEAGRRVLRYDLFGRGYSDRPRLKYDLDLFVRQLHDLLEALEIQEPVDLIGLSMGGPITAGFIQKYPQRVRRVVWIDPAGARPIGLSPLLRVATLPGIGELALALFGQESLVRGIASDFFDPTLVAEFQERYRVQMQFKGFRGAILSTVRSGMLGSFIEVYREVGKLGKPTLLIWGKNDTTVPLDHSRDLLVAVPHAEFHLIEACGHIPHYERPQEVNPILLQFL
ncbi:MAG: alpha/beta fold hydrolase [Anaerolineae bacterium]